MSRKTKAELETENAELRSLVAELERDNRSLREMRDMVLEGAEWDQYKLKVTNDAHESTIEKACALSDTVHMQAHEVKTLADAKLEAQQKLAERNSGVNKINKNAPTRTVFIKGRFHHYRKDGHNLTNARDLANNDLADSEFKYRYKKRWLTKNLKD